MRIPSSLMLTAALLLGAPLAGCQAVAMGVATPIVVQQKKVNLLNASYAAAETLAQQSSKRFSRDAALLVSPLEEIIDMEKEKPIANPKVGRVLGSQIRERFVQLGYNVVDESAPYAGHVTGTYKIENSVITISLRMIDRKSGRMLATNDYSLPVTYEIRQHMSKQNKLFPDVELPDVPYLPPLF